MPWLIALILVAAVGAWTVALSRKLRRLEGEHHTSAKLALSRAGRVAALEEQLREQQAMAQLGEMSAVMAHEMKNPLAGIRGAVEVLGGRMSAGSGDAAIAHQIIDRIDSLNEMVKGLLFFAKPPRLKLATIEIVPLLQSAAAHVARDPALAAVVFSFNGDAPPLVADQDMLRTVFQHLMLNSAQAMGGSGVVTIDVEADSASCAVTVSDTGPGIRPDILDKVFSPFFTTKAGARGLGLPTARRIVEAHGGQVAITKSSPQGTTAVVKLPRAVQA